MLESEKVAYDINIAYKKPEEGVVHNAAYPEYLPTWHPISFPPLTPFEFTDPALRVTDTTLPNLLGRDGVGKLQDIQPGLGTIVPGVQLSELSEKGKDEVAWLVAKRKIVAFPDQDLIDAGFEAQENFMKHFGKLNYQPVSGTIKDHPAFHVIHRDGNKDEIDRFFAKKSTSCLWHQDVSFERQPPGYVMLGLLEGPEVGGDSIFAAADMAYK
jgi:sulfonate dioxygenase